MDEVLRHITPVVLTYNEVANIERVLSQLTWAGEVLVVDSGSTDGTLEILRRFSNVKALEREFDDHTSQWNFGLDQVTTPWVLSLDADYVLTQPLVDELPTLDLQAEPVAYSVRFRYVLFG